MRVLVIGTEDLTGEHVIKLLSDKQHEVTALVGTKSKAEEMARLGAADVFVLEDDDYAQAFSACDAVIYVGDSSARTGESKPILIDHQAVIDSVQAAKDHGVKRFLLMSAMRANETDKGGSGTDGAKNQPEELLRKADLTYTILRTGKPVDKPGKGKIEAALALESEESEIPKEDIATILVEALELEEAYNRTIEVSSGETPIREALQQLDN
ncbi:NAD(P)H-binding protein [Bacillus infantis]|jgi:uncharacterized protein YbjT (DUF2867 family)|uniref:NAD(P)H-binding protein n=1 Tax=Bacillus infantis TaxID=324767 RepID=UPI0021559EE9|nr:NAD(P)H-binding protein [Bacillus infantis]MCR6609554.1 NAD(P)H-binding protein [Bacillus infantis]